MACVSDELAATSPALAMKDTMPKMAIAMAIKMGSTSAPMPRECHLDTTRGMLARYISRTMKSTMATRVAIGRKYILDAVETQAHEECALTP